MFADELDRGSRWLYGKIIPLHDSYRTMMRVHPATTRASDLRTTPKGSAGLVLSVDALSGAPNVDKNPNNEDC
jgi:hypothetical protein